MSDSVTKVSKNLFNHEEFLVLYCYTGIALKIIADFLGWTGKENTYITCLRIQNSSYPKFDSPK